MGKIMSMALKEGDILKVLFPDLTLVLSLKKLLNIYTIGSCSPLKISLDISVIRNSN